MRRMRDDELEEEAVLSPDEEIHGGGENENVFLRFSGPEKDRKKDKRRQRKTGKPKKFAHKRGHRPGD